MGSNLFVIRHKSILFQIATIIEKIFTFKLITIYSYVDTYASLHFQPELFLLRFIEDSSLLNYLHQKCGQP